MKKKLFVLVILTVLAVSSGLAQEMKFKTDMTFYSNESAIEINNVELVESRQITPLNEQSGNYNFLIKDSEGNTVYSGKRLVSLRVVGPPGPRSNQGVSETLGSKKTSFWLNYSLEMDSLEVRKNGETVEKIDLPNAVCTEGNSCTEYCVVRGADPLNCDINETEVNKSLAETGEKTGIEWENYMILVIAFIILVSGIVYHRANIEKENRFENLA